MKSLFRLALFAIIVLALGQLSSDAYAPPPNCTDSGGNHLNFATSTGRYSCGTSVPSTVALLGTAQSFTAPQRVIGSTLTISTSTFTPDLNVGQDFTITLVHASCPCTIANPSNISSAASTHQHGVIQINQSATGSDTIGTWGSQWIAPGGTAALTLSTGANAEDFFGYDVIDSTHILIAPMALNASH